MQYLPSSTPPARLSRLHPRPKRIETKVLTYNLPSSSIPAIAQYTIICVLGVFSVCVVLFIVDKGKKLLRYVLIGLVVVFMMGGCGGVSAHERAELANSTITLDGNTISFRDIANLDFNGRNRVVVTTKDGRQYTILNSDVVDALRKYAKVVQ